MEIYLCVKFHGLILSGWWVTRVESKKKEEKMKNFENYFREFNIVNKNINS